MKIDIDKQERGREKNVFFFKKMYFSRVIIGLLS